MGKNFIEKDAKKVETSNIDIVNGLLGQPTAATPETDKVIRKKAKPDTPQNRFTARFSDEEWNYIQEKHWQTRTSITDMLREYVREDMKKHPEFIKGIDELNK